MIRTNVGKDVVKHTHCWWECKLVQWLWKAVWRFLKKLELELPCDPLIPLLNIYPKECETGYSRDTCTSIFIAALFTIAKLWKQPDAVQLMNGSRKNLKIKQITFFLKNIYLYLTRYLQRHLISSLKCGLGSFPQDSGKEWCW
jgi:hypothetical protein